MADPTEAAAPALDLEGLRNALEEERTEHAITEHCRRGLLAELNEARAVLGLSKSAVDPEDLPTRLRALFPAPAPSIPEKQPGTACGALGHSWEESCTKPTNHEGRHTYEEAPVPAEGQGGRE